MRVGAHVVGVGGQCEGTLDRCVVSGRYYMESLVPACPFEATATRLTCALMSVGIFPFFPLLNELVQSNDTFFPLRRSDW